MNQQNKQGFNDPKTLLAIALTFFVFLGWQMYLGKKYPNAYKKKNKEVVQEVNKQEVRKADSSQPLPKKEISETQDSDTSLQIKNEVEEEVLISETKLIFEDEMWAFQVSSKGMSIDSIIINKFNEVSKKPYVFNYSNPIYPTEINGKTLDFKMERNGNVFKGTAFYLGKKVEKTITVDSKLYSLAVSITLNKGKDDNITIDHRLNSEIQDPKKAVFFLPAFDRNELFIKETQDSERKILVSKDTMDRPTKYQNVKLASLGDHYFATSVINKGKISPDVEFLQKEKNIDLSFRYFLSNLIDLNRVEFDLFIGPKKVDLLPKISPDLPDIVNFSYLGFIARPILAGLNFLYKLVGNYGLAVIILTFLIRLLILPLAVSSFKSMKKMQTIQPELKRIKEKYKDQPQIINQKTMALMKENQVNPLGGCLPMLLQLPIFFAFYRGLSESVDLYQAPFALWITDLSKMDPYFVLPILSMGGMVMHQLVTPSTMDKAQKRMMIIMPVVFGALFVTLPSALTLYMAVSTWFGIGQHMIFLRDKKA